MQGKIKGLPLPKGEKYPDPKPDEELFEDDSDKKQLMEDFGLTEDEARMMRSLNLA